MNKTEKKLTAFFSASLPSGHDYERLEGAEHKLPARNNHKLKIGLAIAIPSIAMISVVAITVSLGVITALNRKPFETGRLKDFSSMQGFGIRMQGSTDHQSAKGRLGPKRLRSSHETIGTPVKFCQYNLQGNYEEAILFNENDGEVRDYHINTYIETHNFVSVLLCSEAAGKYIGYDPYYSLYSYSNEANRICLCGDPWVEGHRGRTYPYVISKRTGKIYSGTIPETSYRSYRFCSGGQDFFGYSSESNPYDDNFYGYEDGYIFFGADSGAADNSALFLVKETEEGLKYQQMLAGTQFKAMEELGHGAGNFFVDRYGNVFHEGTGAFIHGEIIKNTCLDPYNNTIYKVEFGENHATFSYLDEKGEFVIDPNKEGSFVFGDVDLSEKGDENIFNLGHAYYRGDDYVITYDSYNWGPSYKLTFLTEEGSPEYRNYTIEKLPVEIDFGSAIVQENTIYTFDSEQQQLYQLDCKTLVYQAFDLGSEDWKIKEFGLEPNGDIWVKGYSKDLQEVVGYIVDGKFTYEKRAEDAEGFVYYVRPLN